MTYPKIKYVLHRTRRIYAAGKETGKLIEESWEVKYYSGLLKEYRRKERLPKTVQKFIAETPIQDRESYCFLEYQVWRDLIQVKPLDD